MKSLILLLHLYLISTTLFSQNTESFTESFENSNGVWGNVEVNTTPVTMGYAYLKLTQKSVTLNGIRMKDGDFYSGDMLVDIGIHFPVKVTDCYFSVSANVVMTINGQKYYSETKGSVSVQNGYGGTSEINWSESVKDLHNDNREDGKPGAWELTGRATSVSIVSDVKGTSISNIVSKANDFHKLKLKNNEVDDILMHMRSKWRGGGENESVCNYILKELYRAKNINPKRQDVIDFIDEVEKKLKEINSKEENDKQTKSKLEELYNKGLEAYNAKEYEKALDLFNQGKQLKEVNKISGSPDFDNWINTTKNKLEQKKENNANEDLKTKANKLYKEGQDLYGKEEYKEALSKFKEVKSLVETNSIPFNGNISFYIDACEEKVEKEKNEKENESNTKSITKSKAELDREYEEVHRKYINMLMEEEQAKGNYYKAGKIEADDLRARGNYAEALGAQADGFINQITNDIVANRNAKEEKWRREEAQRRAEMLRLEAKEKREFELRSAYSNSKNIIKFKIDEISGVSSYNYFLLARKDSWDSKLTLVKATCRSLDISKTNFLEIVKIKSKEDNLSIVYASNDYSKINEVSSMYNTNAKTYLFKTENKDVNLTSADLKLISEKDKLKNDLTSNYYQERIRRATYRDSIISKIGKINYELPIPCLNILTGDIRIKMENPSLKRYLTSINDTEAKYSWDENGKLSYTLSNYGGSSIDGMVMINDSVYITQNRDILVPNSEEKIKRFDDRIKEILSSRVNDKYSLYEQIHLEKYSDRSYWKHQIKLFDWNTGKESIIVRTSASGTSFSPLYLGGYDKNNELYIYGSGKKYRNVYSYTYNTQTHKTETINKGEAADKLVRLLGVNTFMYKGSSYSNLKLKINGKIVLKNIKDYLYVQNGRILITQNKNNLKTTLYKLNLITYNNGESLKDELIPLTYEGEYDGLFYNGYSNYVIAQKNKLFYLIDINNGKVLANTYDYISSFNHLGYAYIIKDSKTYIINKDLKIVQEFESYNNNEFLESYSMFTPYNITKIPVQISKGEYKIVDINNWAFSDDTYTAFTPMGLSYWLTTKKGDKFVCYDPITEDFIYTKGLYYKYDKVKSDYELLKQQHYKNNKTALKDVDLGTFTINKKPTVKKVEPSVKDYNYKFYIPKTYTEKTYIKYKSNTTLPNIINDNKNEEVTTSKESEGSFIQEIIDRGSSSTARPSNSSLFEGYVKQNISLEWVNDTTIERLSFEGLTLYFDFYQKYITADTEEISDFKSKKTTTVMHSLSKYSIGEKWKYNNNTKLLNETKVILGYSCNKAVIEDDKMKMEIWYCPNLKTNKSKGIIGVVLESVYTNKMTEDVVKAKAIKVTPCKISSEEFRIPFGYEKIKL